MAEVIHVVIPVRGGSVGIPGKNLQLLDGLPLVIRQWRHVVDTLAQLIDDGHIDECSTVTVATDDDQIASVAGLHGATVAMRAEVPGDQTLSEAMELIITDPDQDATYAIVQATAVDTADNLHEALLAFLGDPTLDSMVTASPVTHLTWSEDGLIGDRVNRQQIRPRLWTENGLLHITRTYPNTQTGAFTDTGSVMIGTAHHIHECEVLDIDTPDDIEQARRQTTRATIWVETRGDQIIGSGHVRRQIALAGLLSRHDIVFAAAGLDRIHIELVEAAGYEVTDAPRASWRFSGISTKFADLLLIDDPDLDPLYLHRLMAEGTEFLTFENEVDPGAINALLPGQYGGPDWFLPRSEFVGVPPRARNLAQILVSFGGTDPYHMTERVAGELGRRGFPQVVLVKPPTAARHLDCPTVPVESMAAAMHESGLLITGQGRTVYEAALIGVPTISIAVNERESGHLRLPGVVYLGHRHLIPAGTIGDTAEELLSHQGHVSQPGVSDVVDGRGGARIVAVVEAKLAGL